MTRTFSTVSTVQEVAQTWKPALASSSRDGTACRRRCRARRAEHEAAAVRRGRAARRRRRRRRSGSCARSRSRCRPGCRRTADESRAGTRPRSSRRAGCARPRPVGTRRSTSPGDPARGPWRRRALGPLGGQQLHAEADAEQRHALSLHLRRAARWSSRAARRLRHRVRKRADARQHDAVRLGQVAGRSATTYGAAPQLLERAPHRVEIAHAVVDDRDAWPRAQPARCRS